jgi:ribulose bisphosphate carboxylase small subunit
MFSRLKFLRELSRDELVNTRVDDCLARYFQIAVHTNEHLKDSVYVLKSWSRWQTFDARSIAGSLFINVQHTFVGGVARAIERSN